VHPGPDGEIDTADDITTVDELRLQVDTLYHYKLEARDVLHSFSIPAFRLKQDAVPGRVITGWFEPSRIGRYDFQCAEICGIGHGVMVASVIVESAEDHAAWMDQKQPLTLAALSSPKPAGD
jgi:cytochrome c oxidase subunit 2